MGISRDQQRQPEGNSSSMQWLAYDYWIRKGKDIHCERDFCLQQVCESIVKFVNSLK